MSNKSYAYLLNVKPSHLVFLKTYNTEFDDKVSLSLLISKSKWHNTL